jgi:C4-dicarboxylate transporter DctM subunit
MESLLLFGVFVGLLTVLIATRMPVAAALGLIGIAGTLYIGNTSQLIRLAQITFSKFGDPLLVVIPLFVLMGNVLASGRIGSDLFEAGRMWLNRLPGGLAVSTVVACGGFGAVCGSSPVTAATIGTAAVPLMRRYGYDPRLALGATAAGGTLGIMIPPSVALILYGVITETSVGALFLAGFLPGLLLVVLMAGTVMVLVYLRPELAPALQAVSWGQRWRSLGPVWPTLALAIIVLGSIYAGIATPVEAAAVGAIAAIALTVMRGQFSGRNFFECLIASVKATSMMMLLLVGGLFASFVLTRLGVPQAFAAFLTGLDVPPWVVIALICLLLGVFGMLLDPLSILVITLPIFYPTVIALGYDPIWFGIIMVINIEIAAITPPVGMNLFVLKAVIPGAEMRDIVRGSALFILPLVLGLILLLIFPGIALWLPKVLS